MLDPFIELHLLLGIVFWLGCHQLLQRYWHCRDRQRLGQRRGNKTRLPPLPGLLEKPPCEHCDSAADEHAVERPTPPPPPRMCSSRGRPRQVKSSQVKSTQVKSSQLNSTTMD